MSWVSPRTVARMAHTVGTNNSTVRLFLRTFSPEDAPRLRAYRSDRETARYQAWDPASYGDDVSGHRLAAKFCHHHQVFGAALIDNEDESVLKGHSLHLAINVNDCKLVGDVAMLVSEDGYQAGVNVTLAPDERGQGYARAAVGMALDWLFNVVPFDHKKWRDNWSTSEDAQRAEPKTFDAISRSIGFAHRVHAVVDPHDTAGVNLFTKLGFENDGEYVPTDYYEGEAADRLDYVHSQRDWSRKRHPEVAPFPYHRRLL